MKRISLIMLLIMSAILLCLGCGKEEQAQQRTIKLAAAASLEKIMSQELLPAFTAKTGYKVQATYDGSGKLQLQIEQGLGADLFISASPKQVKALNAKGYIASSTPLLENKLVLITPAAFNGVQDFSDLTKLEHVAIGDPKTVPAGQYAQQLLTKLQLWEQIAPTASLGTNVTEVLQWVAAGSAKAGLVYATDAKSTDKVKIVAEAPENLLKPAVYPMALLNKGQEQEGAKALTAYLQSEEAGKVFAKYGFAVAK